MKENKFSLIRVLSGLILIGAGVYAVFFVDWSKEAVEEAPLIRPLKMFTVGQSISGPVPKYPGKVAAIQKVVLSFPVEGPLVELPIRKGQEVKKGDLLAKIDPRDFENRLNAAVAELKQTTTQLERIKKAVQTGSVSKTDLTNAQAAAEQSEANFKIAQKALEDTNMLAPFDGVISNTFVDNYQNVMAKQEIVTIQKSHDVLLEVNVPEDRIIQAKKTSGNCRFTAVFDSLPNREFDVKLHEYAMEADSLTQTYLITFVMPSPEDVTILPGMAATICEYRIDTAEQDKLFMIPLDAAAADGNGQYYVWKIQKEAEDTFTVRRQNIEVGKIENDQVQVLSGLAPNEKIAASGVHILQEGQKVREFLPKSKESNQ